MTTEPEKKSVTHNVTFTTTLQIPRREPKMNLNFYTSPAINYIKEQLFCINFFDVYNLMC